MHDIKEEKIDLETSGNTTFGELKSKIIMKNSTLNSLIFDKQSFLSIRPVSFTSTTSATLGITLAYVGPIFIILFFYFRLSNPLFVQTIAMILAVLHYSKRTYETNFVNFYEGSFNIKALFGIVFYYWILFAFIVSMNLFNDEYSKDEANRNKSALVTLVLAACMLFSEFNNYACHNILKNLKKQNNGKRGIPRGNMFEYVSCAHYFWELCTWMCFYLIVGTISSLLFVIYSFASMFTIAYEKHKGYLSYFGDKYPKRKIMIPFLL